MSKKSDAFELSIVNNTKLCAPFLDVEHTGGNVHLSDIKISNKDVSTYIEVKMKGAQFGTPRLKFENNLWSGVESNDITNNISEILNDDPFVDTIVRTMIEENHDPLTKPWIGYKRTHYKDHREFLRNVPITVDYELSEMIKFNSIVHVLKNINQNQTVLWYDDSKHLLDIITNYYKNKGANYLQFGDNFYTLDNRLDDKLKVKPNIPNINGDANLTVRFSVRKTHQWIEIIPTMKITNLQESDFSLMPNSSKQLPFR